MHRIRIALIAVIAVGGLALGRTAPAEATMVMAKCTAVKTNPDGSKSITTVEGDHCRINMNDSTCTCWDD